MARADNGKRSTPRMRGSVYAKQYDSVRWATTVQRAGLTIGSASSSGYARSNSMAFNNDASGSSVHRIGRDGASGTLCTNTGHAVRGLSSTKRRTTDSKVLASGDVSPSAPAPSACAPASATGAFTLCARHCDSDQSMGSQSGVVGISCVSADATPAGCAQRAVSACAAPSASGGGASSTVRRRNSANSPMVTGTPIGIFARSCMGKEAKCVPQPSSGDVHCRRRAARSAPPASASPSDSSVGSRLGALSNSQTSASTLLGSPGGTWPHRSAGGRASSPALQPSRRIGIGISLLPRPGWIFPRAGCGCGCCSASTVASTVCTGSSASTASMRDLSGRTSRTWTSPSKCLSTPCAFSTSSGP
mmetsp:Transcript_69779/g.195591  ORF Transcript_69779/g.195591 Transcript_69779/m.195591 type:complete len:361 (+) Transcript_69779:630-1712(+)